LLRYHPTQLEAQILPKMHPCLGRSKVQAHQPVWLVGVLILKIEASKCQVCTLGKVGLSQLPCRLALSKCCQLWKVSGARWFSMGAGNSVQMYGDLSGFAEATSGCDT